MRFVFIWLCFFSLLSCTQKNQEKTLFTLLSSEQTGIDFENTIVETEDYNLYDYEYMYNGGGIGIIDINNDGLNDFIAGGNLVPSKLYLNKGNLQFEDITESAGLTTDRWVAGISIVDINADGYSDIYLCVAGNEKVDETSNLLFINNKDNTFTEKASAYGIDDPSLTTQAAFFDYDLDNDLDLYLLNFGNVKWAKEAIYPKITDGTGPGADKFYRNNGDGTFTDFTKEAGVLIEGYGLGMGVMDINHDGYLDVYVSNDYLDDDIFYINNQKGGFEDQLDKYMKHTSFFAMGSDFGDVNNDGNQDIITVDMLPENNQKHKIVIGAGSYDDVRRRLQNGFIPAYIRNTLQLNNGDQSFSEVGRYSGIAATDWSWGPLLADFNNDGFRDLFVSNGFKKEISNMDVSLTINLASVEIEEKTKTISNEFRDLQRAKFLSAVEKMEEKKLVNYMFMNNGDLTFDKVSQEWGITEPTFSNGVAYADLDNDGDLDLLVHNINDPLFLYKNTLNDDPNTKQNFIRLNLVDDKGRINVTGHQVAVFTQGLVQYVETSPYRGFQSSVEGTVHLGLGTNGFVDSVKVHWANGQTTIHKEIPINELSTISFTSDAVIGDSDQRDKEKYFEEITESIGLDHKHIENEYVDFKNNTILLHQLSKEGPGIAVGDLNNDKLDDIVVGGSKEQDISIYLQEKNGSFKSRKIKKLFPFEDMALLLFDVDADNDLDLYVASGGVESFAGSSDYSDRIYLNDGQGNLEKAGKLLPSTISSSSCVVAGDYDGDNDLDLFVGGRLLPDNYPTPTASYLLRNDGGKFTDVTAQMSEDLVKPGLIRSALWTDFNNDQLLDLILVGEWTQVQFYKNTGSSFVEVTEKTGISQYFGWWNSIQGGDFDNDGDTDYIVGNLGLNSRYKASVDQPILIYALDLDENGSMDPIVFYHEGEKIFPIHARDELIGRVISLRKKFYSYEDFSDAQLDDILTQEQQERAYKLKITILESVLVENLGDGQFTMKPLPAKAQMAPVFGVQPLDINDDNLLDLVLVGNSFSNAVNDGNFDAMNGLVLLGKEGCTFEAMNYLDGGLSIGGDAKALTYLVDSKGKLNLIATQNNGPIKAFTFNNPHENEIRPYNAEGFSQNLPVGENRKRKVERYLGSGYFSQTSNYITLPSNLEIRIQ